MAGVTSDGAFAEYMIADADNTVLLPETILFEQAAPLMCAGVSIPWWSRYRHETDLQL